MKLIEKIYYNDFGMSFYWIKNNQMITDKIQLVFRETGFYFSEVELKEFIFLIDQSCKNNKTCQNCDIQSECHKFLLKTPLSQIDLAVSFNEIMAIKDLIEGTLFQINLENYLLGFGLN